MSHQQHIERFESFLQTVPDVEGITGVSHTTEYIPPHKMAAYCPYDCVVALEEAHWEAGDIEALFDDHDLDYDHVTGVAENDSRHDGETLACVSLIEYNPS